MANPWSGGAANRIQTEKVMESGGAWRLMSFMLFVFSIFLLSYVGLSIGYRKFLESQIENVKQEISALADQVSAEDQDSFLKFQFQLVNLKTLLAEHTVSSKFFSTLEGNTNRGVQYRTLDLDVSDGRIAIHGIASSYAAFTEQLAAYDRMPEIVRYQLTNAQTIENGFVNFNVSIFLVPNLFKAQS